MLPELIYREEESDNLSLLFCLGLLSSFTGYWVALMVFPSQVSILSVVFAAIPLMYPLTRKFLEDEKDDRPHLDEIAIYGSIFLGETIGFFLLMLILPSANFDHFYIQIGKFSGALENMGLVALEGMNLNDVVDKATGAATGGPGVLPILLNNIIVFASIIVVSVVISSAGAFILVWNASVLGIFLGVLTRKLSWPTVVTGTEKIPSPLLYLPHAFLEMSGFIIAGIAGSLVSAAIYREHFDWKTWMDYGRLIAIGIGCIIMGALLEGL